MSVVTRGMGSNSPLVTMGFGFAGSSILVTPDYYFSVLGMINTTPVTVKSRLG